MSSSLSSADAAVAVDRGRNKRVLSWLALGLTVAALLVLVPFWAALILAAWLAGIALPLYERVTKRFHFRRLLGVVFTLLLVALFLTPLLVAALSLSSAALELGHRLLGSKSGADALRSLAAGGGGSELDFSHLSVAQLADLARRHGEDALRVARSLFGAASVLVLGVVVFVAAFYCFLLQGHAVFERIAQRCPLPRPQLERLAAVFMEVGRGLLVGVLLTGLLQGALATVGYLVTGVPQALVLGVITVLSSFVPSVGTALVWIPVTAGLALAGHVGSAVAMLVIGSAASLSDNVVRPLLTRYGRLELNGFVLFLAMLGGLSVFGSGGILLGPLFVRLALEVLTLLREAAPEAFPASRA